ncbi:hypothetical protein [Campylobacter gracilis]|uniref:hypothetical protein n=1 Tax=Campylobacter gracilis TaxID=824 RepID=UPI00058B86D2|nr:hypothetical protein [Campylobacter gracilis]AKT92326.1 putative membrane protein [Campylobacter gracilis]UEB45488.1 hypothetical protein LK410_10945 [Campylobacter gracilis]
MVALILLRYIDDFVTALAIARILIALRGVALIFYNGAVLSAAMVVILALLLPPHRRYHYRGRLGFAVATLMVLMVQGFDLLYNDADEVSSIRIG